MAQPVETTTIMNAQPFLMLLEMTVKQTNKQTHKRYQTHYLPSFTVDNYESYLK